MSTNLLTVACEKLVGGAVREAVCVCEIVTFDHTRTRAHEQNIEKYKWCLKGK